MRFASTSHTPLRWPAAVIHVVSKAASFPSSQPAATRRWPLLLSVQVSVVMSERSDQDATAFGLASIPFRKHRVSYCRSSEPIPANISGLCALREQILLTDDFVN